jgi:uncharacterized membrane protein YgcG
MSIKPTNYVNDYEDLFTTSEETNLNDILKEYQDVTSIEICVVTTNQIFDSEAEIGDFALRLGEKWGVGSSELSNGMIVVISVASRKWSIKTGYGIEGLYPDNISKRFSNKYLKQNFRKGNYAIGVEEFLKATTDYIGYEGIKQLTEKQEITRIESEARAKKIGMYFLLSICSVVVILLLLYLTKLMLKKRKEYLDMSDKIAFIHNDIMVRKTKILEILGYIPKELEKMYVDNVDTYKFKVDLDTYNRLYKVNEALLEHQNLIHNTNKIIGTILSEEDEVNKYLKSEYEYCAKFLKDELELFKPDTKTALFSSIYFTHDRLSKLKNLNNSLSGKLRIFLKKTYNINSIVSAYRNLSAEITNLEASYVKYKKGKSLLMTLPIGKRFTTLSRVDIVKFIADIKVEVAESYSDLEDSNYVGASKHHGTYLTLLAVLKNSFESVSSMISLHNRSVKYVSEHKKDIDDVMTTIVDLIGKSGVKSSRKMILKNIGTSIIKFNNNIEFDIILASTLLKSILEDIDTLYYNVKSDIKKKKQKDSYSSSSYTGLSTYSSGYSSGSSNSNSGFGGFGGGSFGGGGSNGSW